MKVVLLEGLGVFDQVIEQHARKLEEMGHTFVAYPKNADPQVQAERSRDADVIMLANMPLAPSVLDEAKSLKFIDVAFTGVDHIPMGDIRWEGLTYENHTSYPSKGEMLIYTGGISEMEMILAYGSVHFASKVGQLAGNHFLTITEGLDRLYALGRKCLYEGAQPIIIEMEEK